MSAADIDGWRARELVAPHFMGDDEELQELRRSHLILPYLFGDFHPSHMQEYAGGLLLALEKPANEDGSPGGLRPIICGESWRRCLANLAKVGPGGSRKGGSRLCCLVGPGKVGPGFAVFSDRIQSCRIFHGDLCSPTQFVRGSRS